MSEQSETPFRVYRVDGASGVPVCLSSTDDLSLGEALLDLHKMGERIDGILYRPVDGQPGDWLVSPWRPSVEYGRLGRATKDDQEEDA